MRWMDLETVIQSEVSQKEKNKYFMLTHIYMESKKKKGSEEPRGRTGIKTDVENGLVDTGRGKGKLGQSESGLDLYRHPK